MTALVLRLRRFALALAPLDVAAFGGVRVDLHLGGRAGSIAPQTDGRRRALR